MTDLEQAIRRIEFRHSRLGTHECDTDCAAERLIITLAQAAQHWRLLVKKTHGPWADLDSKQVTEELAALTEQLAAERAAREQAEEEASYLRDCNSVISTAHEYDVQQRDTYRAKVEALKTAARELLTIAPKRENLEEWTTTAITIIEGPAIEWLDYLAGYEAALNAVREALNE